MLFYYNLSLWLQSFGATVSVYIELFLQNKGYSHSLIGLIIALGQVAAIICPFVIAAFVERNGKSKWVLLFCLVLSYIFLVPTLLSGSVVITAVCYTLMMAVYMSLNPVQDGILNRYNAGHPGGYSFMRATGTIGYVITLIVFAIIKWPDQTNNKSILLANTLFFVAYCTAIILLPEKDDTRQKQLEKGKYFDPKWFSKSVYVFTAIVAISRIPQTIFDKLFSSYAADVIGMKGNFTLVYAISAGAEFIMMIVGGRLLERGKVKPLTLLKLCCIALVMRLMIYVICPSVVGVAIGQTLHAFTFGGLHIAVAAFYNKSVDKKHSGMIMTIYWVMANYLPQMFGSLAGGWIIDKWGYPTLFVSYSVFAIIAYVLCIVYKKLLLLEA